MVSGQISIFKFSNFGQIFKFPQIIPQNEALFDENVIKGQKSRKKALKGQSWPRNLVLERGESLEEKPLTRSKGYFAQRIFAQRIFHLERSKGYFAQKRIFAQRIFVKSSEARGLRLVKTNLRLVKRPKIGKPITSSGARGLRNLGQPTTSSEARGAEAIC